MALRVRPFGLETRFLPVSEKPEIYKKAWFLAWARSPAVYLRLVKKYFVDFHKKAPNSGLLVL
ncbi:MAG: hypothetical protein WBA89_15670 [Microcoleus sp.]|uniref:hypothetical protein n=1 Tax=Microcoleus sp. TaxID=44472 RepID=UPI003C71687D